ncbi:MAG: cysteine desulfurase NifS [Candidatus Aenigmatarchaeota archaeon]
MRRIYLDHAATTPVRKEVVEAMKPFFDKKYGNASSLHRFGQDAKIALDESRHTIAKFLGAGDNEVIFTSGGTESDNLALIGTAFANRSKGKHIVTSKIEHHAVLHTCQWLEKNGFAVTYLPVDRYGFVDAGDVEKSLRDDTILVSIMHANNEIGTIEPIEEIGRICNEHNVCFHTDAVQSFGKIPINMKYINLLSVSGHKVYGPKGIGLLFIRNGTRIEPILHGGGHEKKMRSGTENIPGIVGFSKAVELAGKEMKLESGREIKLRDKLIKNVLKIDNAYLSGHPKKRLPNNAGFWFKFIEGESLVLQLDSYGIAASTGSACSSKSLEPSHVLKAIGLKHEECHGSLRMTLGRQNTSKDIDYTLDVLPKVVEKLRQISPFKKRW